MEVLLQYWKWNKIKNIENGYFTYDIKIMNSVQSYFDLQNAS